MIKKIKYSLLIFAIIWFNLVSAAYAADTLNNKKECEEYLNKIWITNTEDKNPFFYPSFLISDIENGKVEGKIVAGLAEREGYVYDREGNLILETVNRNLKGTIQGNVIEGRFNLPPDESNIGKVRIEFLEDDRADMYIHYEGENLMVDKCYQLKVYNYQDIQQKYTMLEEKDKRFPMNLDFWGNMYLQTGIVDTQRTTYPVVYLTDQDENIYFEFHAPYINGTEVSKVIAEDFNGDGTKDIKFWIRVIGMEEDERSYTFIQREEGGFYLQEVEVFENITP